MGLIRLTTTPTILDTADIASHLRITGDQDNDELDALQLAAVDYIERQTRAQIGTGTFKLTLDGFPRAREILIPRPPLKSIESINLIDPTGQTVALDSNLYRVDVDQLPGRIILKSGQRWPHTAREAGSVIINFTAGYDEGEQPETILHLIRLICGAWFELREGAVDRRYDELPLPFTVSTLIQMHSFPEA
jgi:uncharacterized phiE125 gp8 family phage protein